MTTAPFRWWFLCGYLTWSQGWLRLGGWGVSYKDTRRVPLLFSERQKLAGVRLGRWLFHFLRPD